MFNPGPNRLHRLALMACFLAWPRHAALSDCPPPEAEKAKDDSRRDSVDREAQSYKFSLDGDESDVTLIEEPVLRWGNGIRGATNGGTFLWTADGVPVATCCIWWSDPRTICLTFGSLTEKPIQAEKKGKTIWHSTKPGLEYHDVPDAPAVARSATARLTQLRNIARDFSAVLVYGSQGTEELRLLTQPLYRYGRDDAAIKDGAVFAFATGTDPELILQIEAVGDDDALRWRYAVTRRTSGVLRLSHKDDVVWSCTRTEGAFGEPFFVCPAP
ncbi:MAG TPA: hypothetical protein VHC22_30665 [Pirellulales bacterium]|nr:hypothetical protein [Pirellulales bacterium]